MLYFKCIDTVLRVSGFYLRKGKRGFSLSELLITVAIVGILGGIAVPTYLKQAKNARRSECTNMLTSLRFIQEAYIGEEGFTYNGMHCPKVNPNSMNTVNAAGTTKNALLINISDRDTFCNTGASDALGFPVRWASPNFKVNYQYRFRACKWDEIGDNCPAGASVVACGPHFPSFGGGVNKDGYTNPGNLAAWNAAVPGLITANTKIDFHVACHGNIDSDGTADTLIMDVQGDIHLQSDDINN